METVWCVWEARAVLGEGPVWCTDEGSVYWVDIKGQAVHRYGIEDDHRQTWPMPERIGWVIPRRGREGFVAGLKSGLVWLSANTMAIERITDPEPDRPGNRLNDATADASGRIWFGTMDDEEREPSGSFYRLDTDLTCTRVDGPYTVSNGPTFSPDGSILYHTDTAARTVYAFDVDEAGALHEKRVFVRFQGEDGSPDGMTTDEDGGVWIAHWGGGRVTRFLPNGRRNRTIVLPVPNVTRCTFAGSKLDRLFITTASVGLREDQPRTQPLAGGLFEADPGTRGLPTRRFGA